jgi:hypothetical protein
MVPLPIRQRLHRRKHSPDLETRRSYFRPTLHKASRFLRIIPKPGAALPPVCLRAFPGNSPGPKSRRYARLPAWCRLRRRSYTTSTQPAHEQWALTNS